MRTQCFYKMTWAIPPKLWKIDKPAAHQYSHAISTLIGRCIVIIDNVADPNVATNIKLLVSLTGISLHTLKDCMFPLIIIYRN